MRFAGWLFVAIPVGLVSYWGAAYIAVCYATLLSCSSPIEYHIETQSGGLTLRTEAWMVDLAHNKVIASKVTARDSSNRLIAQFARLEAYDAIPWPPSRRTQPMRLRVSDGFALVERDAQGEFSLSKLQPKISRPSEATPFKVEAESVRLLFTDRYGTEVWRREVAIHRADIEGYGSHFTARGSLAIEGAGDLEATVVPDQGGFAIRATTQTLELAPIAAHIAKTPDANALPIVNRGKASRLIFGGEIEARVAKDLSVRFEAKGDITAADVVVDGSAVAQLARFHGTLSEVGASGDVEALWPGGSAKGRGAVAWDPRLDAGFDVDARSSSADALPAILRKLVPADLKFAGGTYRGWIGYRDDVLTTSGRTSSDWMSWGAERIEAPSFLVASDAKTAQATIEAARWANTPVTGTVAYRFADKSLAGMISAKGVKLETIARRFRLGDLRGSADATALISGLADNPQISLSGNGQIAFRYQDRPIEFGDVELSAMMKDNQLVVSRLSANGPSGVATAQGVYSLNSGALDFDVFGSNVPASLANPDFGGTAIFSGKVRGTSNDPQAEGRVEVYDAEYDETTVPLVVADVELDKRHAVASQILALQGSARLDGSVSYSFGDRALNGNGVLSGLSLGQLLGDKFAGSINASRLYLTGTTDQPHLEADLDGRALVAGGYEVDDMFAQAVLDGRVIRIESFDASREEGRVTGTGSYDLDSRVARYKASASNVAIGDFVTDSAVVLAASLSGNIEGSYSKATGLDFSGNAHLDQVAVNGTFVGQGSADFSAAGNQVSGTVSVGGLDRYLEASNVMYDLKENTLGAEVLLHNISLQSLVAMSGQSLEKRGSQLPEGLAERLRTLQGNVDADAAISGTATNPDLAVRVLGVSGIKFDGLDGGDIEAKGSRTSGVWTIDSLTWTGGPGVLAARGTIDEHGDLALDGDFNNLSPAWFAGINPTIGRMTGQGDISFRASGPTRSPLIEASVGYREGDSEDKNRRQVDMMASIEPGSVTLDGNYYFEGFTGPLSASIPFKYPLEVPPTGNIMVRAELPPRNIKELKDLLPWLDVERSAGTVSGQMTVSGTRDDLQVGGQLNSSGTLIAAEGVKSELRDFTLDGLIGGGRVRFDGTASGSDLGSLSLENVGIGLSNLSDILAQGTDGFLESPLSGTVRANAFPISQGQSGQAAFSADVTGEIAFSGTLKAPVLSGTLSAAKSKFSVGELPTAGTSEQPYIDPRFDVTLALDDALALDAGTGKFKLTGGGRLGGSLGQPDLGMDFEVDSGSLRLPNARVFIEPGGTIAVRYRTTPFGPQGAEALVNLTGRTQLTAPGLGESLEFYSITLEIRGDVLVDNGLQINASSDPPGLSQDRILALLGQGELLAGSPGSSLSVSDQFRAALSIALPYVIGGVTEKIGAGLGLDYLALEYGGSSLVTVTAAKSLGKYFVLSGRRQVSSPLPGLRSKFDLRLSYRPPVRNRFLNRLSFSLGVDQDRPWKVSIEYGIRF